MNGDVTPFIDDMARAYAISGTDEARAYLDHPVLGERLRECCRALLGLGTDDAQQVLGGIDAVKLRSSMTLFMRADPDEQLFTEVLEKFFGGEADPATDERL